MGHQYIVHVTLSPCCKERRQSLSLQRCGHLIRQIWNRWTTASGYASRGLPLADPWRGVERTSAEGVEAAGPCTPSSRQRLRSDIVVWMHVFAWMVDILNINFWASDFLLCFVCFVDTGCPKCDRYKHVQSANIVWNVLLLCLRISHGMVAIEQMYGKKLLRQWLWPSLVNLCTKNYENPSIFVKVTKKISVTFFSGHGV